MFALVAAASIFWSLTVLRWSISRRFSRWTRRVVAISVATIIIAAVSIVSDVRSVWAWSSAPPVTVAVSIRDMGDWLQLFYRRGAQAFVTANELHVPAATRVVITWNGPPLAIWRSSETLMIEGSGRIAFLRDQTGIDDVELVHASLRPRRHLRIIVDAPATFDRWFNNQLMPAPPNTVQGQLFDSAGCSYCHVIRGIADSPSVIGCRI